MKSTARSILAGVLIAGLLTCPSMAASAFPDVDEYDEYAEAVEYISEAGIMIGDAQGYFNPNQTVTRAEMAVILCKMLDETDNLTISNNFSDVPQNHWANKYVTKAAELGAISGYGNGKFGPSDNVTYEQAITMIVNALNGFDLAQAAGGYPNGYLSLAIEHNLLDGVTSEVGEPLSRSDIAIILFNCNNFYFNENTENYNDGSQTN